MRSTKIFFENGYHRIELGIEEVKASGKRPDRLVMRYTKKPIKVSIPVVGPDIEMYCSDEDALMPNSGDIDIMMRHFKRVLKGRNVVPEDAFTRFGCLCDFFSNIRNWMPKKKSLL